MRYWGARGCGSLLSSKWPLDGPDFKAPFIKFGRKLSNLPLPVRRLSSQTPLRGRRKDILWTDQRPAGSHNKRFLLWHFVNTGKWRKLFGNIICWWFENVEEKYIFKFGSSSKNPPLPLILLSNSETNFSLQWNWKGFFDQYDFQSIT